MNNSQRYQYLVDHFKSYLYTDKFELNRVNYNFLLTGYNQYLITKAENKKIVEENKQLKLQIELLEMYNR